MYYGKYWCEIYDTRAFYFATVARTHIRLIGIAVKDDCKGQGIGKATLYRLLQRMAEAGVDTLTFRTSMHEDAQHFWLKQGAKIMDVKGDDYEINMLVSQFEWRQASGYNCNSSEKRAKFEGMTMADYMRWLWNNPQNGQSPYKLFEGALVPIDKDLEGNLIYKFNGARF